MKYIVRSLKYLVKLVVLLAVLLAIMLYSETSTLSVDNFFADFFSRWESWMLLAAVVVWSGFYPRVEFVRRSVGGNLREDKIGIINAMRAGKMMLADEKEGVMVFHSETPLRRLWWVWEDTVTLTQGPDGEILIDGPRRFVTEAQQRIPGYVERSRE